MSAFDTYRDVVDDYERARHTGSQIPKDPKSTEKQANAVVEAFNKA